MEEKKRYAWLDIYKARGNTLTYDHLEITEPFNEFFEGIIKLYPSPIIKRLYTTTLHLIGLLTIQKRLRKKTANRQLPTQDEMMVMSIKPYELFWEVGETLPKAFMFSTLPRLTVPKEFYKDLQEIAVELIRIKKISKPTRISEVQSKILERMLVNNEVKNKNSFIEDGFTSNHLQGVFKMFMKMKNNAIADSFYRHYEMAYFLNMYYRERQAHNVPSIFPSDVNFLLDTAGAGKEIVPEENAEEGGYERRIKDRKFVLIMHAMINRFIKQGHISKRIETYIITILHTLLLKEDILGYFEDFSAEILIIGTSYIGMKVYKKETTVRAIYEMYRSFGFISHFRIEAQHNTLVGIDDLIKDLLVNTYNTLLPSIVKNLKARITSFQAELLSKDTKDTKDVPGKVKYMLSPLPGRMSQIVQVPETSKKVLFAEKRTS